MGIKDRLPSDPRKRESVIQARAKLEETLEDQEGAAVRAAEKLKLRKAHDKLAVDEKARNERDAKADAKVDKEKRQKARKAYLNAPLTEQDRKDLEKFEIMAMSGQNPHPDNMRRLADLRIKSKVKGPKKEEKPK